MKYARIERERRFLLAAPPDDLNRTGPHSRITDRYIPGTRLRLRSMESETGAVQARKLTQKFATPGGSPLHTTITNLYLDEAEFQLLVGLEARVLVKRRYTYHWAAQRFSIDIFAGPLHGLILAEVEGESDAALDRVPVPAFALCEVTDDPVFTGGHLVTLSAAALQRALQRYMASAGSPDQLEQS